MFLWLKLWILGLIIVKYSISTLNLNESKSYHPRFKRIVNSNETPKGIFEFLTFLQLGQPSLSDKGPPLRFIACSSTIISKRHILTAAHCVARLTPDEVLIQRSPILIDFRPKDIEGYYNFENFGFATKVYLHRGYSENYVTPLNDIAIIELPNDTDFEIEPVILSKDYVDDFNDIVIAAGYGRYLFNATSKTVLPGRPARLRHAEVNIHPMIDCCSTEVEKEEFAKNRKSELHRFYDDEKMICAGKNLQRADQGDSGGPLLYENEGKIYQIGIVSFGSFDIVDNPVGYTRVSYYCDWIEMVTKGEAKCQHIPKKVANDSNAGNIHGYCCFWILLLLVLII